MKNFLAVCAIFVFFLGFAGFAGAEEKVRVLINEEYLWAVGGTTIYGESLALVVKVDGLNDYDLSSYYPVLEARSDFIEYLYLPEPDGQQFVWSNTIQVVMPNFQKVIDGWEAKDLWRSVIPVFPEQGNTYRTELVRIGLKQNGVDKVIFYFEDLGDTLELCGPVAKDINGKVLYCIPTPFPCK